MQIFGRAENYLINVGASAAAELKFNDVVSSEHLIKIIPDSAGIHVLLTPASSSDNADANDYLLIQSREVEFLVGRGLDRISVYNTGGSSAKVYVMVLF